MNALILYTTDYGRSQIKLAAKDQTVWLSQRGGNEKARVAATSPKSLQLLQIPVTPPTLCGIFHPWKRREDHREERKWQPDTGIQFHRTHTQNQQSPPPKEKNIFFP